MLFEVWRRNIFVLGDLLRELIDVIKTTFMSSRDVVIIEISVFLLTKVNQTNLPWRGDILLTFFLEEALDLVDSVGLVFLSKS